MGLADLVERTFPELDEIKNEDLRNKVVEVYVKAMMDGGWDSFDGIPFTKVIKTDITYVTHVRTVTKLAIRSAKTLDELGGIKINMDFLVAGGLLHDVGKLFEYSEIQKHEKLVRHPFSGAGLAMACDMPPEVVHIIAMHAKEGDLGKRIPEAVIVHHCDFIHFETVKALTGQ
jgi:putative nucleotidyltransferase with HDIG domain